MCTKAQPHNTLPKTKSCPALGYRTSYPNRVASNQTLFLFLCLNKHNLSCLFLAVWCLACNMLHISLVAKGNHMNLILKLPFCIKGFFFDSHPLCQLPPRDSIQAPNIVDFAMATSIGVMFFQGLEADARVKQFEEIAAACLQLLQRLGKPPYLKSIFDVWVTTTSALAALERTLFPNDPEQTPSHLSLPPGWRPLSAVCEPEFRVHQPLVIIQDNNLIWYSTPRSTSGLGGVRVEIDPCSPCKDSDENNQAYFFSLLAGWRWPYQFPEDMQHYISWPQRSSYFW